MIEAQPAILAGPVEPAAAVTPAGRAKLARLGAARMRANPRRAMDAPVKAIAYSPCCRAVPVHAFPVEQSGYMAA